ncbi:hypothetical protein GALMADRAFT_138888 [Galerina marginata CBS 339.88]|uniref:Uncharacterized protein n=1 Tax=Galerina marginata (strain CBS 339.88) TaxID=685588 RepID=A0A067T659_GALM3|nr:hypothetical protein GALMADRAFT_138888 [Galerina marginata CBS 339.88]
MAIALNRPQSLPHARNSRDHLIFPGINSTDMIGIRSLVSPNEFILRDRFIRRQTPSQLLALVPRLLDHACDIRKCWSYRALALQALVEVAKRSDVLFPQLSIEIFRRTTATISDSPFPLNANTSLELFFFVEPVLDAMDVLLTVKAFISPEALTSIISNEANRLLRSKKTACKFTALTILTLLPTNAPQCSIAISSLVDRVWFPLYVIVFYERAVVLDYAISALISAWGEDTLLGEKCKDHHWILVPHIVACMEPTTPLIPGSSTPYLFTINATHRFLRNLSVDMISQYVPKLLRLLTTTLRRHGRDDMCVPAILAAGSVAQAYKSHFKQYLPNILPLYDALLNSAETSRTVRDAIFFAVLEIFQSVGPYDFRLEIKRYVDHAISASNKDPGDLNALFVISLIKDYSPAILQDIYKGPDMAQMVSDLLPLTLLLIQKPHSWTSWNDSFDLPSNIEMRLVIGLGTLAALLCAADPILFSPTLSLICERVFALSSVRYRFVQDMAFSVLIVLCAIHGLPSTVVNPSVAAKYSSSDLDDVFYSIFP